MKKLYTLLTALLLCTFVWGDAVPQTYCDYEIIQSEGKSIIVTWQTCLNGDIRVSIKDGEGVSGTTFRNGAFEGDMNGFKVLSGDGYAIEEAASVYFTREWTENSPIFWLHKKSDVTLPNPCIVSFSVEALAWKNDADGGAYIKPAPFDFEYGANCDNVEPVLSVFSLTEVTATTATFHVEASDENTAGVDVSDQLTYTVTDVANNINEVVSPDGSGNFTLSGLPKNRIYHFVMTVSDVVGNSATSSPVEARMTYDVYFNIALNKICSAGGYEKYDCRPSQANEGNQSTFWGTYGCGSKEGFVDWQTTNTWEVDLGTAYLLDSIAIYRGGGGGSNRIMTLKGKVNEADAWSTIFNNLSTSENTSYRNVLAIASARYLQISFAGTNMIAVKEFEVYGHDYAVPDATDPTVAVTEISKTINSVTLQIIASDKDDDGNAGTITAINISGNNGFVTQNNVTLDGDKQITLSGLKNNKTYTFTVQVIDLAGNSTSENIVVVLPFNTAYNIALDGTASAGYSQNSAQSPDKANDGSTSTKWNTYGVDNSEGGYANNWWQVQLDSAYNITSIVANYRDVGTIDFVIEGSINGSSWYVIYQGATTATGEFTYNVSAPVRYVRYTYGNRYITVNEFEIYASGFAVVDEMNPTVTASCVEKNVTSATLQILASDKDNAGNDGSIISIKVSDVDNGLEEQEVSLDGENKVTLSELKDNTTYNFTVKVVDYARNEASTVVVVELPFNTKFDLAYKKECTAGAVQDNNTADKAVNGNPNNFWTCFAQGDASTTWWSVDLGTAYDIDSIMIHFNDLHAAYNIYSSLDESDWYGLYIGETASSQATKEYQHVNHSGRYLKVTSSDNRIGIKEFKVYATGFSVPDATVPEVTINEIDKDYTSVTLQINATDEDDDGNAGTITAINISGNNGFVTQNNVTLDGDKQITLSGLKNNKTYTFTVQVIDLAGNSTSENIVVVLPFNTAYNIALDGTASAGYSQNSAQSPDKANDGSTSTKWNTYGVDNSEGGYANNWWQVQLDAAYAITSIVANYQDVSTRDFVIEGSMDGSTWYVIYKGTTSSTEGEYTYEVAAPAQYVRYTYGNRYLAVYEFKIYASGFSTLTDDAPVITWAELGEVTDNSAEIEIDAADLTTKPITTYVVTGAGEDPIELVASEGKITLTSLSQSTNYSIEVQAKDGSGNLSVAKRFEFTTTGSASGLYLFAGYFGWNPKIQERAQFSTTSEPGVLKMTIANMTAGDHNYKLYNADLDRCTFNECGGVSDHYVYNEAAIDVSFYATDEDHFVSTLDTLYLRGSLVGEDQELTWNESRTVATWTGTIDLNGTKQFTLVKKLHYGTHSYAYDHDIYTSVQTFDGSYTQAVFTFDVTKMQGVWAENKVNLTLSDNADNAENISNVNTRLADVTLNRGFIADGGNYTLVLPFDMTAEQCEAAFGADYQLWYLSDSRIKENGDIYLNFVSTSSIVAGRPYLFCPAANVASGAVISDVQIKSTLAPSETAKASFVGTYDVIPQETISTTANAYLLGGDNWLYAAENSTWDLKALRAYFTLNFTPVNGVAPRIRVVYNETGAGVSTDLDPLTAHPSPLTVTKLLRNGQLIIIRNGVEYNAQGQIMK